MQSEYHLIIDGETAEESWVYLDDETPTTDAPCIISLARLKAEADTLRARNAKLGVVLLADDPNKERGKTQLGEDVRDLVDYLDILSLVSLKFPTYRNGRGYSAARILREELKFDGEIRASGDVLYDQWAMMARCGVNAFELAKNINIETFQTALDELSDAYQPAADKHRGALWARHAK